MVGLWRLLGGPNLTLPLHRAALRELRPEAAEFLGEVIFCPREAGDARSSAEARSARLEGWEQRGSKVGSTDGLNGNQWDPKSKKLGDSLR